MTEQPLDEDTIGKIDEENEEAFAEASTISQERYDNLPETFSSKYFSKDTEPFEFQMKVVSACLEAERAEKVRTNIVIYGKIVGTAEATLQIGSNSMPTGSGKSLITFMQAVEDMEERQEIFNRSTQCMNIELFQNRERRTLPFSIILASKILTSKWKEEAEKYLKDKYWRIISKETEFRKQLAEIDLEDYRADKYIERYPELEEAFKSLDEFNQFESDIRRMEKEYKKAKKDGETKEQLSERKDNIKRQETRASYLERKMERDFIYLKTQIAVEKMMKKAKILIVSSDVMNLIFPMFQYVRVQRLFIDEVPINVKNDDSFQGVGTFRASDFLADPRGTSRGLYSENSPALFIWIISATVHKIVPKNNKDVKKYFSRWMLANCPIFADFANITRNQCMFPELINTYIVKLKRSFTLEQMFGKKKLYVKKDLFVSAPRLNFEVGNLFENDSNSQRIQTYIQNDDTEALCNLFGVESTSDISEGMIGYFNKKIADLKKEKKECKLSGEGLENYKAKRDEQIKEIKDKIKIIEIKRSRLFPPEGEEDPTCTICMEQLTFPERADIKTLMKLNCPVVCQVCGTTLHYECFAQNEKVSGKNYCCTCRGDFTTKKPLFIYNSSETSRDIEEFLDIKIEEEEESDNEREESKKKKGKKNKMFDTKLDALEYCLKRDKDKILLYTNLSRAESAVMVHIVQMVAENGYKILLPRNYTRDALKNLFGKKAEKKIIVTKTQADISKSAELFREIDEKIVFILDSTAVSAGLDFPCADAIICMSLFNSSTQILGRVLRLPKTNCTTFYTIRYKNDT